MSLSAILVMLSSIIALWGVATATMIYSMKRDERKINLLESQNDFEPLSPRAMVDAKAWLERHPEGEKAREMRELLDFQYRALTNNARHLYAWEETGHGAHHP